jgi:CRP-like cAMP-binding protein
MSHPIFEHLDEFVALSSDEKNYFLSLLTFRTLKKKTLLLKPGEYSRNMIFVIHGCLRSYYVDQNECEYIVEFGMENNWIADMQSFMHHTASKVYIDALENSDVALINYAALEKLFLLFPNFERYFRIIMQEAFIRQQERLLDNLCKNARERYIKFLTDYPDLEQRIPQYQIASFLGFTPQFLSQIRSMFCKEK